MALKICEWQGQLLDVELATLRRKLNRLRDYLFKAAGQPESFPQPSALGASQTGYPDRISADEPLAFSGHHQVWHQDLALRLGAEQ